MKVTRLYKSTLKDGIIDSGNMKLIKKLISKNGKKFLKFTRSNESN